MERIELPSKKTVLNLTKAFPRAHAVALAALACALLVTLLVPSKPSTPARQSQMVALPSFDATPKKNITAFVSEHEVKLRSHDETIKSGDNLSKIFKRAGLSDREMMELMQSNKKANKLASLMPGRSMQFLLGDSNQLEKITYITDKLHSFSLSRNGDGFDFNEVTRVPDVHWATREGIIEQSLYLAASKAGLDDSLIMSFAEMYGWDVDFALDIRKGDSFKVLYEEKFLDGEKLGNGAILSAEFINQGKSFSAVRYVNADGRAQYYTADGKNMRKAFLRAPLDFRRISSNFNPKRLHPITKRVKPHRGIDYAADRGTPIWSSGDGKVIKSGYTKYNGNYIVIQHGNNIETKYLHLHKRHVKRGQRVRQKQIIGTVGSTGLSNAPHLHYEFLLNGVHRNPRTIVQKLPKAKSIATSEMTRFTEQTQQFLAKLDIHTISELALSESGESKKTL